MTKFIEVTDAEHRGKMLINVDMIIYVCTAGNRNACIRYANSEKEWAVVSTAESYDEVGRKIRNAGR